MMEFPEEIVIEILLKVPVKSLLKFKRVCKLWDSIISSPQFIKNHLNGVHATHHNQHKKFLATRIPSSVASNRFVLYEETSNGYLHAKQFDFPLRLPADDSGGGSVITVSNYCDGLICFNMHRHGVLIWNPSLPTEYKIISPVESVSQIPGMLGEHMVAMGYDSILDDYKIVRIPSFFCYEKSLISDCSVEFFSLKSNSWRKKKLSERFEYYIGSNDSRNGIYTRNRMHWLAPRTSNAFGHRILYVDMVEESLGTLNLPSQQFYKLLIYKDSLAVVNEEGLWVLVDYSGMKSSWNKVFGSEMQVPGILCDNSCFKSNGDLVGEMDSGFVTFDTKGGVYRRSVIEGDDIPVIADKDFAYTCAYVESLVSPRRLQ